MTLHFLVNRQGSCSSAVIMIPAPTGTENRHCFTHVRITYMAKNTITITLATVLNVTVSFSLSFRASLSIGLHKKICIAASTTPPVNRGICALIVTNLTMNMKSERSAVEDTKHTADELRWNPPLNFLISMNGMTIRIPSITMLTAHPMIITRQSGSKLNRKLYAAYSYSSLSSSEMAPVFRSHFEIAIDAFLIILPD